ncbi:hypothetical protein Z517_09028 [Fonsecaea pedrosoi CBS 271.37]|uniref:Uncharacterized protein n=1 Tax=Fonsecaea pedrosoi CBS 271.37 TaxID=1442368 RepID=A0A0D2GW70_9EURO|nr:uncharacterized protein Z517_09028 [Fonsecaea pedrosoi CBS 271.37]KIW76584.1 hypothetical protein Z517_09028 [Fonsecaea pedrosoi CBS 271.37]
MPSDSKSCGGASSDKKDGSSSGSGSGSGSGSSNTCSARTWSSEDYDRLATAVTAAVKAEYGTYGGTTRDASGNESSKTDVKWQWQATTDLDDNKDVWRKAAKPTR